MSSIERRLAEGIVDSLSEGQIESTENNTEDPRPGFRLKVQALKNHLGNEVPDERYTFQQIAIRALVHSILYNAYGEAFRIQNLSDVHKRFDSIVELFNTVGVLPEKDPARPLIFEEPTRILADSVPIEPSEFRSARRDIK